MTLKEVVSYSILSESGVFCIFYLNSPKFAIQETTLIKCHIISSIFISIGYMILDNITIVIYYYTGFLLTGKPFISLHPSNGQNR